MPYDHELYLKNCRKMIGLNQEKVQETKAQIRRTNNPAKKAMLAEELVGWQNWVQTWKDRLSQAEELTTHISLIEKEQTDG